MACGRPLQRCGCGKSWYGDAKSIRSKCSLPPCVHRGELVATLKDPGCGCRDGMNVFRCEFHELCTPVSLGGNAKWRGLPGATKRPAACSVCEERKA